MDAIKRFFSQNLIWLIGILIALGGVLYTVKDHTKQIETLDSKMIEMYKSRTELKLADNTVLVKLDAMQNDLKDIKIDLREVKQILYKPARPDTTKIALNAPTLP